MVKGVITLVWLCLSFISLSLCEQMMWNMDQCPDQPKLPMTFEDMTVDNKGDVYLCKGKLVVHKDIGVDKKNPIKVQLNGYRCDSQGQINCPVVKQFESKDLCADLKKDEQGNIVVEYMKFLNIDQKCPFKKGTIPLEGELPIQYVKMATMAGKHWLGSFNMTDNSGLLGCQMIQLHFEDTKKNIPNRFG